MNATDPEDDPEPEAPVPPDADACCGSGCERCVFDVYQDGRERYLEALRAWQERQAGKRAVRSDPLPTDPRSPR